MQRIIRKERWLPAMYIFECANHKCKAVFTCDREEDCEQLLGTQQLYSVCPICGIITFPRVGDDLKELKRQLKLQGHLTEEIEKITNEQRRYLK